MAVRNKASNEVTETQSASAAPASAPDSNTGDTGNGGAKKGARKGVKRGPLDPAKRWATNREDKQTRDAALARVLKDPSVGSVKTASSIAEALAACPEFAGVNVSAQMVKTRLGRIVADRKAKGKEIGAHLLLDKVNLGSVDQTLFD